MQIQSHMTVTLFYFHNTTFFVHLPPGNIGTSRSLGQIELITPPTVPEHYWCK